MKGRSSEALPIVIRSTIPIDRVQKSRMREQLAHRIRHSASVVKRGTVRFEDINGPRGGVDTVCRIKLVLNGRPSVQVDDRAHEVGPAFAGASQKAQSALKRVQGKHGLSARQGRTKTPSRRPPSTRTEVAASSQRTDSPPERRPMKIKTARRPPARRAVKVKARRAKQRVGVQRGRR
jgi:hypothetical protein